MRTKIDWPTHLAKLKESGLSTAEYCRRNGLNIQTVYNARRRKETGRLIEFPALEAALSREEPALEFYFSLPFSFQFRLKLGRPPV